MTQQHETKTYAVCQALDGEEYRAVCTCGWRGGEHLFATQADQEGKKHVDLSSKDTKATAGATP